MPMPSNNSQTACKVAVETIVGPLAMSSSGKPSGEWRTVTGCSKKLENHWEADAVSPGKANVLVGIFRRSPGTESVTELTSGAKAARIKWMAVLRLPLTHWPSAE